MSSKPHETRKAYWLPIINDWKASKKTVVCYCKENNFSTSSFYKWKSFFDQKPKITLESFVELQNNSHPEMEIEFKKYIFRIKEADISFIGNFIKLLKDF